MKVKIYFIGFVLLFAFWAQAKHVTVENAQSVAQKYLSQTTSGVTLRSAQTSSFTLVYTAKKEASGVNLRSAQTGNEDAYFYIFNTPDGNGFIIVSADDRAYPVLGYSMKGAFDYDKAPPAFLQWIMDYQEEIENGLNVNPLLETNPEWQKIRDGITFSSADVILGTAEWDQGNPYNLQCPLFGGQRTITGCVATAMAIAMKYNSDHGLVATGTGSHTYTWNGQDLTANFGTYDWTNMPDKTSGFTNDTQRNAVARLMSHCGISIEAEYGVSSTGADTRNMVAKALIWFFGYDQSTEFINRTDFTDAEWKHFIQSEIDNNHPIIYRGSGSGNHAFICEGYNTDKDEYYFNWGWDGSCNGFFLLDALKPSSTRNYSEGQGMVIGIKKGSGIESDMNQICLTSSGGGKGMSKNMENIEQNRQFTVTAGALNNTSFNAFRGRIAVALTDESGSMKEIITTQMDLANDPLNPGYYYTSVQFSCVVTKTIAPSDLIRMVTSTDNGVTWKIITGKTGVVDFLTVGVQNIAVTGVSLNSNAETLTVGGTFQLTSTIVPANATNKNVTWTTSNANVAEVNASGLVTAKATGTSVITVTTADGGKTATCAITVQSNTVSVTGVTLNSNAETLTVSGTFQLTATVTPANATNKNVTWTTSDASVAVINTSGLVTAQSVGTATITVTTDDGAKTATCAITVQAATVPVTGVSLNSNAETLTIGGTFQLTATITPANATNKNVTWTTSDASVAVINTSGLVTAQSAGTTTITVTTEDGGKTATCTVTVQAATVPVTGVSLNSNAETLTVGNTFQLTATVAPANATNKNVTWSSSNSTVAEVSGSGLITAKTAGTTTITVRTDDGNYTATCTVTVNTPGIPVTGVSLNTSSFTLYLAVALELTATITPSNATNKNITWSSSNPTVANVRQHPEGGFKILIDGLSPGTATITVTTEDGGYTASCVITVPSTVPVIEVSLSETSKTLNVGQDFGLNASIHYWNATNQNVTWTSSNPSVASVSPSGLACIVTANAAGTATITATTQDGGHTATCIVTVTSPYLASGTTGPLTWTLTHDGTLTFSGSGAMPDYPFGSTPWHIANVDYNIYSVVIEANVTSIGRCAFTNCHKISSVTIPNSVVSIGDYAFYVCAGLTSVIIPNSVITIGDFAFEDCYALSSVMIGNSVSSIGEDNFRWAHALTSVTIPASVKTIGLGSFTECSTLTSINVDVGNTVYSSDAGILYNKNKSTLITCPAGMSSVTIPAFVTTIGNGAFTGCVFSSISIPNTVQRIEGGIFYQCTNLSDIAVYWASPLSVYVYAQTFSGVNISAITLHVPAGTKALYLAAPVWKDFGTIVEDAHLFSAPYSLDGVTGDEGLFALLTEAWMQSNILHVTSPMAENITIYSLSGSILYQTKKSAGEAVFKVDGLPRGILIVRGSSGWTQKIIMN